MNCHPGEGRGPIFKAQTRHRPEFTPVVFKPGPVRQKQ